MSNLTADLERRHDVHRHPDVAYHLPNLPAPPAHVSVADRLSLRLGLWLLVRSVEHVELRADHSAQQLRVRNDRAREARERAFARERMLWPTH
jgi:hypothetical protein